MHIEKTTTSTKKGKSYCTVFMRESYRYKGRQGTVRNISSLPGVSVEYIRKILAGKGTMVQSDKLETADSLEYGASFTFVDLNRQVGLDILSSIRGKNSGVRPRAIPTIKLIACVKSIPQSENCRSGTGGC